MSLLTIETLSGGYGATDILHGVHLRLGAKEVVVIIGPNGAGKSTLMKAVFGLIDIRAGTIHLGKQDITGMATSRVVSRGISYVPQNQNVFATLTVEENLEMGAYLEKDPIGERLARIYELFPDLAEKRRAEAGTLSGGQRQMVAMGKALMSNPQVLLLDEPTAGLSPKYQDQTFAIVRRIHDNGTPILMVEQNAKQALAIADRAYVLVDGKNFADGSAREIRENRDIAKSFLAGAA
ncbi:MAG: ABC transporter ATP-binding protein [Pseudomonadota bacterium]